MVLRNIRRRTPLGFTLIELLVVVAIIALLISILLPSLNRAKQQARQLVCLTNLKSQGEAAHMYADENKGWIPRGIMGINQVIYDSRAPLYHLYCTAIIKYLGWNGEVGLLVGINEQEWNLTGDTTKLYNEVDNHIQDAVPYRVLNAVLRKFPQYHCPDFPGVMDRTEFQPGTSPMDYVASAMPIPYTERNYQVDQGNMEWDPSGEAQPENAGSSDYESESKLDKFPSDANPAALVYVTEANVALAWNYGGNASGPRFHHFFLGSQLPFGSMPRIADDQRHPGGLNALFFDGHCKTMELHQMDVAYPNSHAKRLKYFSVMYNGYTE